MEVRLEVRCLGNGPLALPEEESAPDIYLYTAQSLLLATLMGHLLDTDATPSLLRIFATSLLRHPATAASRASRGGVAEQRSCGDAEQWRCGIGVYSAAR